MKVHSILGKRSCEGDNLVFALELSWPGLIGQSKRDTRQAAHCRDYRRGLQLMLAGQLDQFRSQVDTGHKAERGCLDR